MRRLPARRLVPMPFRIALAALLLALLAQPAVTWAHPLGNFTVNRYTRLDVGGADIRLRYIVDMAEIPTFQELGRIDADRDGVVSAAEHDLYLEQQVTALQANLQLVVSGKGLMLEPQNQRLEFPEGQGGLKTLRLSIDFVARPPASGQSLAAEYHDQNFAERIGWQEVVVHADGATLLESTAPAADISNELRSYPQDMLQSPPAVSSASFRFQPAAGAPASKAAQFATVNASVRLPDRFSALIAAPVLDTSTVLIALALAFGLGAAHAMAPGHGKTIVAAYLVGARGTVRHAIFLGLTTTITHTAGVFALGLVTLLVSEFVLPEQLYPWLGVISGALVFSIGITLFRGRLRSLLVARDRHFHHGGTEAPGIEISHSHDHDHDHTHSHDHDHGLLHDHGDGHMHSHLPPDGDGGQVSWRSLLALGVSGGLLPCPSALVVLLGAIALGRVGFGLLLIIAFSLGLAGVLTAIGVLLVYAGRLFKHIPNRGPVLRALPVASALLITIAGIGITVQALIQTGIVRL